MNETKPEGLCELTAEELAQVSGGETQTPDLFKPVKAYGPVVVVPPENKPV